MKITHSIGFITAVVLILVWAGVYARDFGGTLAGDAVHESALQACPSVDEEIVDLEILADGLKQSDAVGLFEKVRLKSAIDSLLKRMKKFHNGDKKFSAAQLQEQYDVLLMRIASHLQDKDIILHSQLCNAWDMIWLDLEDPDRFAEKFS